MLMLTHITKAYRDKTVLQDISVTFQPGRLVSIIGPNGAGKSTLLGVITQLSPQTGGEVRLDDRPITAYDRQALAKRISFLRQSNAVNVRLTVRELIAFGRFPYSQGRLTKEDEAKIEGAIQYLQLEAMADRFIDQLSGGERQRAFIAMTLAQDTDYVLLDEPLNNLDMKHSVQIMKALRQMVDQLGKTVVIVIHDINFASFYSDEIIAIKQGQLVEQGDTGAIINEDMLRNIYDMDIRVTNINDKRLCEYFQ